MLHVLLDLRVGEVVSDKSLGIENGVLGVPGFLGFGGFTDQSLVLVESDVGRHGVVSLLVGDDFNLLGGHDSDARVGSSKIDTDSGASF